MSTNNSVFQVLVTSGDQALLAAGNRVNALAVGQLGVFNFDTGLSINAAAAATTPNIFIAVGLDTDGDSVQDDILTSAGTHIKKDLTRAYNLKCYSDARPQIIDITNYENVKCEADYAIRLQFTGLTQVYQMQGYNQFNKTYTVTTPCCGAGCDCPTGDCNVLTQLLVDEINNDIDGLVTAEYLDYTTTPGSLVVVAPEDVAAWIANEANAGKCLGVRITGVTLAIEKYCCINLKYYKLRTATITASFAGGLDCEATATVFQTPAYQEGSGYDINQLEYQASGWNGKAGAAGVYRQSAIHGMPFASDFAQADKAGKYLQINLHYDQFSVAGWNEYLNNLHTIVAIPCGDDTTAAALLGVLDAFTTGRFDALTDDFANCSSCTGTKLTSAIDNYATDGLG